MSNGKLNTANGKRTILVADDEMINREILGSVLEEDYEILFAEDGQEALDQIRANRETLSLVLLDLMMPKVSGIEVLKQIKEDASTSQIPVIVATADQNAEIECLTFGAIDFISKPYPQAGVIRARVLRTIELFEDRQTISSIERDPLSGLYNKEFFFRYVQQFDQHNRNTAMDALVLDINHFRMFNERYGRAYADDVLCRVGKLILEEAQRRSGLACRRENDIFLIYCPHQEDYSELLREITEKLNRSSGNVRLRLGVYENADKDLDVERRFDRAVSAADTVRNSFSNNIGYYDNELHEKELFSELLLEEFPRAIREEQFLVYFQPKYDIRAEAPYLCSAEALVRWKHPKLGMISPAAFVPLFEENGLIPELDHYVWRHAAAQIQEWKRKFNLLFPVSVNVSRVDMYDPQLRDTFCEILGEYGLSTDDFHLEITESAYTKESHQIIDAVNLLREIGFQIEMDDFGTGYSSLNMISRLPIDALKLDMNFIQDAFRDGKDTRMIEVIIDIARYLNVPVIAEGVETEEQLLALKSMSCDMVQGYYFSKPVPADEFERFLIGLA